VESAKFSIWEELGESRVTSSDTKIIFIII